MRVHALKTEAKNKTKETKGYFLLVAFLVMALSATLTLFSCEPTDDTQAGEDPAEQARKADETLKIASMENPSADPLVITEICLKNTTAPLFDGTYSSWIEVHNTSKTEINLADFALGTSWEERDAFPISAFTVEPDGYALIYCDGIEVATAGSLPYRLDGGAHSVYVLNVNDELWLTRVGEDREVTDYVPGAVDGQADVVRSAVEVMGSMGRLKDAVGSGAQLVYFSVATAGNKNHSCGVNVEAVLAGAEAGLGPAMGLKITEVTLTNTTALPLDEEYYDLVELTNVSGHTVNLSDFCLSDKYSKVKERALPNYVLPAGQSVVVFCDADAAIVAGQTGCYQDAQGFIHAPFSLGAKGDEVWLTNLEKEVLDYVAVPGDVPLGGSYAAVWDGVRWQWQYFETPQLRTAQTVTTAKSGGSLRVTPEATALKDPGVYDKVASLTVEFYSSGTLYYTLDGSVPTTESRVYAGPLTLTATTVVRTLCMESGCLPGRVSTFSYIINEGLSLPVVSMVTDNAEMFSDMCNWCSKDMEVVGNVALYENGTERFNANCGIGLKGWTSIYYKKQSFYMAFRGKYGDGDVDCDVFDSGVSKYSSLTLRAGQDYIYSVVRNEFLQNLVLQANSNLLTQHSKYCIVFVNGEYHGLFCMKDDLGASYYANYLGVEKSEVEYQRAMNQPWDFASYLTYYPIRNDMAVKENYDEFCRRVNIDSLIDYFIFEGYSANSDTLNNLCYFRSDYSGGQWYYCFYDLDWSFNGMKYCFDNIYYAVGNGNSSVARMIQSLGKSPWFREALFTRLGELLRTTLSDENVLTEIEKMREEIASDLPRDYEHWGNSLSHYKSCCDELEDIIRGGYAAYCLEKVCAEFSVTDEERAKYFSGI